jgi:predicted metal-binding membrane protein
VTAAVRRLAPLSRLQLSAQVRLLAAVAAVAWIACAWLSLDASGGSASAASASRWWCMPVMALGGAGSSQTGGSGLLETMSMWLLMTAAMALPGELPAAQYVATNSFARHRSSGVAVFAIVYLAVWTGCGLAITTLVSRVADLPASALFAIALALAAGYELTPLKRRALARCHRGMAFPPDGPRRLAAVSRFGWINASGCIGSCGPAMAAALLVPVAQPLAMIAFSVAMTYQRLTRKPLTARRRVASGYVVVALGFVVAAI